MKYLLSLLSILFCSLTSKSQEINQHFIDSALAIPQTLELKISTPQPRLKEKVELSLDLNYIRAQIFRTEFRKFEAVDDIGNVDQNFMVMKFNALEKGKQVIGPLSFILNGTKYTTNKIEYEVIDALPNVDKGVWIRKIIQNDSIVYIIIEQRIPANGRATQINNSTTKYWTEPVNNNVITMQITTSISGLEYNTSSNFSEEGYFYNDQKQQVRFLSGYSINVFKILDKNARIEITKKDFLNLPSDYKFQNIIVQ